MHEKALMAALRKEIDRVAREQGSPSVRRVRLRIGALSHLTEAELRSHWPEAFAGSPALGAALDVQVSQDLEDPNAQTVVLESVDLEERTSPSTA